ncbi:MAG: hypothetical protein H6857_03595 [Rhodospirillales bacterium]|nr:hypothetical protein [Rhodospirillales bacterium]MCB9973359.1 hypothetical protein [Rhodospirillales bacterium]
MIKKVRRLLEKFDLRQGYYHYKAGLPTQHLIASLDQEEFRKLLKYKDDTGHPQYKKYFNAPYWLRLNIKRALSLGLNRSTPLNILDIGSGFGYFPYVAHFYGHQVKAIDLPGDVLFKRASEFLHVNRYDYAIAPMTPFRDFEEKFDLITAFQVCFNGHIEGEIWHAQEWDFFLSDLFRNHITPGGRVYLEFNWSPYVSGWMPAEVKTLFRKKYRARFQGESRVTLFSPVE